MNQNLVAWSCRGMCGTKLKNRRALLLCAVMSHAVVLYRVAYVCTKHQLPHFSQGDNVASVNKD